MENSPRLKMPYLASSQAQKHVTHNEALRYLDGLVQINIKDRDLPSPPTDPAEGDCYFIAANAVGEWAGKEFKLACFQDGAWAFHQPHTGYAGWIEDESIFVVWSNAAWIPVTSQSDFMQVGINTNADEINRLSVKSDAVLFDHQGAGTQIKLNKSQPAEVGSIIFQTDYSGRVEIGTIGAEDLLVKTSADGAFWINAMSVSSVSGKVTFPNTPELTQIPKINMFSDGGRFGGVPEPQSLSVGPFEVPAYIRSYNNSVLSEGPPFINNNATYGGSGSPLDPAIADLISTMRSGGGTALQYGPEFYSLAITAGNDTKSPLVHQSTTYFSSLRNSPNPLPPKVTMGYWVFVVSGEILLNSTPTNLLHVDTNLEADAVLQTNSDGWHHVVRTINLDENTYLGYYRDMFQIYATPATQYLLAAPFMFFGHVTPESIYIGGCNPSIASW